MIPLRSSLIEQELYHKIQESMGNNARAMSATIVGFSRYEDAPLVDKELDLLLGRRPVRLLHLRGYSPSESRYWVEARCLLDRHKRGICLEDICIETPDDEAFHGRIWGPLTIRELPVLLYWNLPTSSLGSCHYDCLQRSDLMLITSERDILSLGMEGEAYLHHLCSLMQEGYPLVDLTWESLWPLRFAISRLFVSPYHRGIPHIRRITLTGASSWILHLLSLWFRDRLFMYNLHEEIHCIPSESSLFTCLIEFSDRSQSSVKVQEFYRCRVAYHDGNQKELVLPSNTLTQTLERLVDSPVVDETFQRLCRAQ